MSSSIYEVPLKTPWNIKELEKGAVQCVRTKEEQDSLIWYKGHPDASYRKGGKDIDDSGDLYCVCMDFILEAFGVSGDDREVGFNGGEPDNIVVQQDGTTIIDYLAEGVELPGRPAADIHVCFVGKVVSTRSVETGDELGEFAIEKAFVHKDGSVPAVVEGANGLPGSCPPPQSPGSEALDQAIHQTEQALSVLFGVIGQAEAARVLVVEVLDKLRELSAGMRQRQVVSANSDAEAA